MRMLTKSKLSKPQNLALIFILVGSVMAQSSRTDYTNGKAKPRAARIHSVSVAPQGGELGKRTGAEPPPISKPHTDTLYIDSDGKIMMSLNGGPYAEVKGTCEQLGSLRKMLGDNP